MNNTFYLLRHAEPQIDRNTSVYGWELTEGGRLQAENTALSGCFDDIDIVASSTEKRAFLTATPIADRLGKDILIIRGLNELGRGSSGFLESEEFGKTLRFALTNLDKSLHGWETALDALSRFSGAIEEINVEEEGKRILAVSHGCVLSLYFAELLGRLDEVYGRWKLTGFCSWGIVKEGKVLKDIV